MWKDIDVEEAKATLKNYGMNEEKLIKMDQEEFDYRTDILDYNSLGYLKNERANNKIKRIEKITNQIAKYVDTNIRIVKEHEDKEILLVIEHLGDLTIYKNGDFTTTNNNDYKVIEYVIERLEEEELIRNRIRMEC